MSQKKSSRKRKATNTDDIEHHAITVTQVQLSGGASRNSTTIPISNESRTKTLRSTPTSGSNSKSGQTKGKSKKKEKVQVAKKTKSSESRINMSTTAIPSIATSSTTTNCKSQHHTHQVDDAARVGLELLQPLPNVLADIVMEYYSDGILNVWKQILKVYESLKIMPRKEKEEKKKHTSKVPISNETSPSELMPKLKLSPPVSPHEIELLEREFQLKYAEPNFQFPFELKLLWSIANGLECPQNTIFRGRFWPSMETMRKIIKTEDDQYYVIYHNQQTSGSCSSTIWLKYDFHTGVLYSNGSWDDQDEEYEMDDITIVYHSMRHFMNVLLAVLKIAPQNESNYRSPNDDDPFCYKPKLLVPAVPISQLHGFVPEPKPAAFKHMFFHRTDIIIRAPHELIHGHLGSAEFVQICSTLYECENDWFNRYLHERELEHDSPERYDSCRGYAPAIHSLDKEDENSISRDHDDESDNSSLIH